MITIRLFVLFFCSFYIVSAQSGIIKGRVVDAKNNEPIPFASVIIQGSTIGANSDELGNYVIENLQPGTYNLTASYLGYDDKSVFEILVSNNKPAYVDFEMNSSISELDQIVIKANPFTKKEESPVSLRTIGTAEIQRNPGGNRDISKVVQTLPGVTSVSSFRNDLLIRGGGPGENRFYLDDVEVPNINHFATQGASGGPVGMINVDFIREVNFYSSAFPANRGNALSSVFSFQQKNGRDDRLGFSATVGSSDLALTMEGPLSKNKKTTFIASARQSYLQFLFKLLELPFLPTYNDFQIKVKHKIDQKNEIYFIGLGAIDRFKLNLDANETEEQRALLDFLDVSPQWNYTNGLVYKHYAENGYWTFVLSRNMLNNRSYKYKDNIEVPENLIRDFTSREIENKLRIEHNVDFKKIKWNYGFNYEQAKYSNDIYQQYITANGIDTLAVFSKLNFHKYGLFASASKRLFKERLSISAGLRADGNSYSKSMSNPLEQISPRIAFSYRMTDKWSANFNTGFYYQLPAYTILGYRDNEGVLVNKNNKVKYIHNRQIVGGLEYATGTNSRITLEGYFKQYYNYPFSIDDNINLANVGQDFGVIGNEAITSKGEGRAYGLELLFQQKMYKGYYGIFSYTLGNSQFTNADQAYIASSWDSRHIVNMTMGKQFKKNWEIGINFRMQSGLPYTPYDYDRSALVDNWSINPFPLYDYTLLNSERTGVSHELDIRIDKKWYWKNVSFNLYFDVNNVYGGPSGINYPTVLLARDESGNAIIENPLDAPEDQRYQLNIKPAVNTNTALPTIGIIFIY